MNELKPYIDAVIQEGKSIKSQAELAKVNVSTLRRMVLKDPRYGAALQAGKIMVKDFSSPEELRKSELVIAIVTGNMTIPEAVQKYGLTETSVRNRVKKAYPDFFSKRNWTVTPTLEVNVSTPAITANPLTKGPSSTGLLPLIGWDTARDWDPAAQAIPLDKVETWMAAARPHSPHSYILRVEDNSMTALPGSPRTFPQGSLIFVDCGRDGAAEGDRIIARVHSTGQLVFRVYHANGGKEWLEPLNSMHEPIREPFKVIGHVFGKWEDA